MLAIYTFPCRFTCFGAFFKGIAKRIVVYHWVILREFFTLHAFIIEWIGWRHILLDHISEVASCKWVLLSRIDLIFIVFRLYLVCNCWFAKYVRAFFKRIEEVWLITIIFGLVLRGIKAKWIILENFFLRTCILLPLWDVLYIFTIKLWPLNTFWKFKSR